VTITVSRIYALKSLLQALNLAPVIAGFAYPTINSALLRSGLQQWGLLRLPRLRQGRLPASELEISKSELLYDWRFTANHFVLGQAPGDTDQSFFKPLLS
jgi:hypothetical protein